MIDRHKETIRSCVIGAAIGDAMGVPFEFLSRAEVRKIYRSEMCGNDIAPTLDSYWGQRIPAGCWSDDTSMMVASMDAIAKAGGQINAASIMDTFLAWWRRGQYCSWEAPFGLGGNISKAFQRYDRGKDPDRCGGTGYMDNGNGALMRILPFSLLAILRDYGWDQTVSLVSRGSSLTHAHEISRLGCVIFTEFLRGMLAEHSKEAALDRICGLDYTRFFTSMATGEYRMILAEDVSAWKETELKETGYVADTLQAAVFSIMKTGSFEDAISTAILLGYDTDTTACVTGQLAAALYGTEAIPARWMEKLKKKELLEKIAAEFAAVV